MATQKGDDITVLALLCEIKHISNKLGGGGEAVLPSAVWWHVKESREDFDVQARALIDTRKEAAREAEAAAEKAKANEEAAAGEAAAREEQEAEQKKTAAAASPPPTEPPDGPSNNKKKKKEPKKQKPRPKPSSEEDVRNQELEEMALELPGIASRIQNLEETCGNQETQIEELTAALQQAQAQLSKERKEWRKEDLAYKRENRRLQHEVEVALGERESRRRELCKRFRSCLLGLYAEEEKALLFTIGRDCVDIWKEQFRLVKEQQARQTRAAALRGEGSHVPLRYRTRVISKREAKREDQFKRVEAWEEAEAKRNKAEKMAQDRVGEASRGEAEEVLARGSSRGPPAVDAAVDAVTPPPPAPIKDQTPLPFPQRGSKSSGGGRHGASVSSSSGSDLASELMSLVASMKPSSMKPAPNHPPTSTAAAAAREDSQHSMREAGDPGRSQGDEGQEIPRSRRCTDPTELALSAHFPEKLTSPSRKAPDKYEKSHLINPPPHHHTTSVMLPRSAPRGRGHRDTQVSIRRKTGPAGLFPNGGPDDLIDSIAVSKGATSTGGCDDDQVSKWKLDEKIARSVRAVDQGCQEMAGQLASRQASMAEIEAQAARVQQQVASRQARRRAAGVGGATSP